MRDVGNEKMRQLNTRLVNKFGLSFESTEFSSVFSVWLFAKPPDLVDALPKTLFQMPFGLFVDTMEHSGLSASGLPHSYVNLDSIVQYIANISTLYKKLSGKTVSESTNYLIK